MTEIAGLSAVGLGTSRAASLGSRIPATQFEALFDTGAAAGLTLIDTSDAYGSGDAERLVGSALAKRSQGFFVVTKAGLPRMALPAALSPLNQVGKKLMQRLGARRRYDAPYLVASARSSIGRLGVERLDAFLLHEPRFEDLVATSWAGLAQIKASGLARFVGVSTSDERVIAGGFAAGQLDLVQTAMPWDDGADSAILTHCRAKAVPVIVNSVLVRRPVFDEAFSSRSDTVRALPGLAGITLHQLKICLALTTPGVTSVLAGTSNPEHLADNLSGLRFRPAVAAAAAEIGDLLG